MNNKLTENMYDNLKQELSNSNEYELLLYLILQVEYGIGDNDLSSLRYSQVKFPYIENVRCSRAIKGIIPCYINIKINNKILDLIFKMHEFKKSDKFFENSGKYYCTKISNLCGKEINSTSIQKMRMQYLIWSFNTIENKRND